MTKLLTYSKAFHWLVVLLLLTPFYYSGCNTEEVTTKEDTIAVTATNEPGILPDSATYQEDATRQSPISTNTDTGENNTADHPTSLVLSNKFPFLKPILIPKDDTYSGLAICIDSLQAIPYFSTFFFALFLVFALVVKYIDKQAYSVVTLLNLLAIGFLSIAHPLWWQYDKLWGYWVSLVLMVILVFFDAYVLNRLHNTKSNNQFKEII